MKKYEEVNVEVITFAAEDVIAASPTCEFDGGDD
jgi:hypothetical protein